ncbi:efflux RND transporter periplasmic adaptor subunit [Clostridiaceae bacterium UIB06]|uniref:Efflux RND transporter periplasmic adaptor subunit n=1 Tax=Clostridium thailandense TaxID=2794346 RepID=A0A949WV26_9CLOT|nr:efflux RND transporter periplasmic adaptor subunit [Clostridium thailandense]MBV7273217.1 efflux RND transporter periplasmic adaptor subunit [Clostridium thailandense]MCH5136074.1 efflux RND transporter periplasmic adaptor subunit [Clostridiaceae bacterium UIB06]
MKKTTLLSLIVAVLLSGCGSVSTSVNNSVQATKNVQQSTNNQFIMAGKIQANDEANVGSKISAKVSEVSVDVGSKVKQGDVIVKLDTQDLQAQVDQAQAAVNTAKANLANAQNTTRPEQITSAQASLDSANESYDVTKKNYDRIQALVASGAAAQQQLDSASQQLAAADAAKKSAEQQLAMLKNGPTQTTIDVYQAQVGQAEASLKVAQASLDNATITAPISGVVSAKNINVGEMASTSSTLISIVNDSGLYVNAYAPFEIVDQLKEGQNVIVKVSEVPEKQFEGKIAVINSKLNSQSRNVLVKVTLEDPDSVLKPGMFAEIGLKK